MSEDFTCREAATSDYNQLCALEAELDSYHVQALPSIFQHYPGKARERSFFFPEPGEAQAVTFVVEKDQALLGFICLATRASAPIPLLVPRKYAVIDSLYVSPHARRMGIAHRLMDLAETWSKLLGCTSIELNVYAFNQAALEFYREEGFADLSRKLTRKIE